MRWRTALLTDHVAHCANLGRKRQWSLVAHGAGPGTVGLAGNGGPAAQAQLKQPYGVATCEVIPGSNRPPRSLVYVADTGNNLVRVIIPLWT